MDGDCCQWTLCRDSTLAGSRGDPKTSSSESKKPAGAAEISKEYTAKKFSLMRKKPKDLSDMASKNPSVKLTLLGWSKLVEATW